LLIAAVVDLFSGERVTLGTTDVLGHTIWAGWPMIAAVGYSVFPMLWLGRRKHEPARILHDKTLATDADMNKADWMTGIATAVGVAGLGIGWWWADPAAAAFVSGSILYDGITRIKRSVQDLMDHVPTDLDGHTLDVGARIEAYLRGLSWVGAAEVRCRQEGRFIFVEALVLPGPDGGTRKQLLDATQAIRDLDWKIDHVIVSPTLPAARASPPMV
jgi:divalent metal cation (Fe/Co/Zn/Cd) transporter